jgi:S-DNA-T family DNA segregation ATPase FtsK/SpoIIIE
MTIRFFKGRWFKELSLPRLGFLGTEFLALLLLALTSALFISLISYDADTPNWLGPFGSRCASLLFNIFGVWAFLIPLSSLYCALAFIFDKAIYNSLRFAGFWLFLYSIAPVLAYYDELRGGLIAAYSARTLSVHLGFSGLIIVCITAMASGLLLFLQKPYIAKSYNIIYNYLLSLRLRLGAKKLSSPIAILPPLPVLAKQAPEEKKEEIKDIPLIQNDIAIIERDRDKSLSALKKAENEGLSKEFTLPPLKLLDYDAPSATPLDQAQLKVQAEKLQRAFLQFGIEGTIREIRPGPVVTNFEFVPAPGIKLSRIAALSDDIAMAMFAVQVRIVTPIPGKGAVGIEVPNARRETVYLKEIVADENYRNDPHKLSMAIGKDVEGTPFFMNLADMPHVLIAGTTGSGKSVSVNAMICSILYRATPQDVRFLMIDPKMLELSLYNGIPHLLLPPIIDAKKAGNALRWAVKEMDERYNLMKETGARDIISYNEKIILYPEQFSSHTHMPYIVIVVDEYADLLAVAGKDIEGYIMRLAQKARACGIHVMLATQRPSVDVITGVIKANFPVRMGFRLASSHDSKTIINKTGAEKLLGRGDLLIMPPGTSDLYRVHGAYVSEKELSRVVKFWQEQKNPEYDEAIADFEEEKEEGQEINIRSNNQSQDEKFEEAIAIVRQYNRCSTSFLQRQLAIGYNRAARIVEHMEKSGIVGPVLNAKGEREIFK